VTRYGEQGDLLGLLAGEVPRVGHIVMPNMAAACGADLLDPSSLMVFNGLEPAGRSAVTCPECHALNVWDLQDAFKRMQGRS
jgi:hypothetical protein